MVFAARSNAKGHRIATMDDLMALYENRSARIPWRQSAVFRTPRFVQKFAVITVAVVGASRRFPVADHQTPERGKVWSASLQYSNYTGQADFAVPYERFCRPGCGPNCT